MLQFEFVEEHVCSKDSMDKLNTIKKETLNFKYQMLGKMKYKKSTEATAIKNKLETIIAKSAEALLQQHNSQSDQTLSWLFRK